MEQLIPTFIRELLASEIETVMLCGCGGGFDFVHSLMLYPYLREAGKNIVIGSYSFGDPDNIGGNAPIVYQNGEAIAKQVSAQSHPPRTYCPEVHVSSFLDKRYPQDAPHTIYAYYARAFTVKTLTAFYRQLIDEHSVDAIVLFDGGSDSLMKGDEDGLGDPVEDAVSVATVACLDVTLKRLICVGLGADRFNNVSDAATLRAIAELTLSGAFKGSISLEKDHTGFQFYRDCIDHIYQKQDFRSIIAGLIISAVYGFHGGYVPPLLDDRVEPGEAYIWPLMAVLWGFDVDAVAQRSLIVDWLQDCETQLECLTTIYQRRSELYIRDIENLPRQQDIRRHNR